MNNKTNILIVEDDACMNKTVNEVLSSEGYSVDKSFSSLDAINKIVFDEKVYNILVLDYNLNHTSDVTGIDIFKLAKEKNKKVKAVMISGFGDNRIKQKALSEGISIFLDKPFLITDLIRSVNHIQNGVC